MSLYDKPFRVECFTERTGWLLFALSDSIEAARAKAAHAFMNTKHTQIRIVEASQ